MNVLSLDESLFITKLNILVFNMELGFFDYPFSFWKDEIVQTLIRFLFEGSMQNLIYIRGRLTVQRKFLTEILRSIKI